MPEGHLVSMDSPVNKGSQFETYITSECSTIEITYRTINDRKGPLYRFIYGWSWSIYLSAKHQNSLALQEV
jgi:hypothetical protein